MHTYTQPLCYQLPTPRTPFARVARINLYDATASFFRFAGHDLCKLIPRCVSNAFRKAMIVQHPAYIQLLDTHRPETPDDLPRFLMHKVATAVGDPFVNVCDNFAPLRTLRRAFVCRTHLALRLCKRLLIFVKETRIADLLTCGKRSKLYKPNVNAHGSVRNGMRLWLKVNTERHKPLARRSPSNRDGLDSAINRAMQHNLERAELTQDQVLPLQSHPISVLRIGQTVVASIALEAWVASLLASSDTTKERLERQINAHAGVLQHLAMDDFQRRVCGFQVRKEIDRIVQTERFLAFFPRLFARSKRFVVHPPSRIQHAVEDVDLPLRWEQTELVRFLHRTRIVYLYAKVEQRPYVHKTSEAAKAKEGRIFHADKDVEYTPSVIIQLSSEDWAATKENADMADVRILIGEDNDIVAQTLKDQLTALGYEVAGVATTSDEVTSLSEQLAPDLVILDMQMAELGSDTTNKIVAQRHIPLVILTPFSDAESVQRAEEAGALAYLVKPPNPEELPPAIDIALARHREMQELRTHVDDLHATIEARKVVERAIGILMKRLKVTRAEAEARLRQRADGSESKLKEIAQTIVDSDALLS
jgi:two-component system, response regulator PdtaR